MSKLLTAVLCLGILLTISVPTSSQIRYNIQGDPKLQLSFPAPAFIGDPTFSLEELTYALANTPCGNCPDKKTYDNLMRAYGKVAPSNKLLLKPVVAYFQSLGAKGYCPHLPSTGSLTMALHP